MVKVKSETKQRRKIGRFISIVIVFLFLSSALIILHSPNISQSNNMLINHGHNTTNLVVASSFVPNNSHNDEGIYSPFYYMIFTESGLPSGTWYVNFTVQLSSGTTVQFSSGAILGTTVYLSQANGTYSYTIGTTNKIYAAPGGSFAVNESSNITETVTFSKVTYITTFTEIGFLSGITWYANLTNGINSGPITGSAYSVNLTNGSYSYTIQTSNKIYSPSPSSGSFTVNGFTVYEYVTFSIITYHVILKESGLPVGLAGEITWYFNGTELSYYVTSSSNVSLFLSNGTYNNFIVTAPTNYYTTTPIFSFIVNGSNVTETVQFYHWAYITGILSPDNAMLTVNGNPVSVFLSGYFNLSVANGSYHVVASENGYTTYYNNFTINNGNVKNLAIDLTLMSKPSTTPKSPSTSSTEIYVIVGVVAAIAVIADVVLVMRKRK